MTSPTTPNSEPVVSQADRDAAAALIEARPVVDNIDIIKHGGADDSGFVQAFARHRIEASREAQAEQLNDIAVMMSEFVDNWPEHKKFSTSLALIAKTLRASRAEAREAQAVLPGEIGELIERLRSSAQMMRDDVFQADPEIADEAADTITSLQSEQDNLRHDLSRQVAITTEQANEIAELQATVSRLEGEKAEAWSGRERLADALYSIVEETKYVENSYAREANCIARAALTPATKEGQDQ